MIALSLSVAYLFPVYASMMYVYILLFQSGETSNEVKIIVYYGI